jgi:hypothetical protein
VPKDELIALALVQLQHLDEIVARLASSLPASLQTQTIARLVDWMPIRSRQAAEAIQLDGLV